MPLAGHELTAGDDLSIGYTLPVPDKLTVIRQDGSEISVTFDAIYQLPPDIQLQLVLAITLHDYDRAYSLLEHNAWRDG